MEQEQIIQQLVSDAIESGRTVEEVCREHPEHLSEVRSRHRRARVVEQQVQALFPSSDARTPPGESDAALPQIPGYEVQRLLGYGGMGVVYQARHISLNRIVAIKVPRAGALATASERHRHMREARAVAALGHPNIITLHDVGEFDGRPFLSMEFIDGPTLGDKLANTPQPAHEAATLIATLADATLCAHQAGIIHRDLKPTNILLAPDGTPKITDFGLARQASTDVTLTVTGFQFGTPSYMSPEQATDSPAAQTPSVDIYSLGAVLYEMLTGRPPFRAENAVETLRQVLEEEPAPLARLNPKVPRDLETICLTCLRKEPRRRYASAGELAGDLRRFLRGEPIQARPVAPLERLYLWGRRRPAHAGLVAAGICAVIAGVGFGFWTQYVQNARAAEASLREGRARQAIETAVALVDDLRTNGRWIEARHVLDDAHFRVAEARSDEMVQRLDRAEFYLTAASDLADIRRRYPETGDHGYNYAPAAEAYKQVFARLGFGAGVPVEDAGRVVDNSPIRKDLLIALDNAAFVARVTGDRDRLDRYLAIARTADPDPWRDRFRLATTWHDRDALLALYESARSTTSPPPTHQFVIIGALLSGLNAIDKSIDILRDAHRLDPVDFWVNIELGNSLTRAGSPDSCQYYRAAATIQPTNAGPWVSLAVQLDRIGSSEESIIAIRRAIELNPHLLPAWRNYVTFLSSAGRLDDAEAALSRAIELNPDQSTALSQLRLRIRWDFARAFAAQGKWQQALEVYRSILPGRPADAEYWFEIASISLIAGERGEYDHARDVMLKWDKPRVLRPFLVARTVTLTPTPFDVVNAVAALSDSELRRTPTTFWNLRQRGALLCRADRYVDAIPFLEQSLTPNSPKGHAVLSWLWLAIAHHHLGHSEEAARWRDTAAAWLDTLPKGMPDSATAQGLHLHDWLEAHLLRQEAETLLSTAPPDGIRESLPAGK